MAEVRYNYGTLLLMVLSVLVFPQYWLLYSALDGSFSLAFPQYWLLYSAPDGSFSSCFSSVLTPILCSWWFFQFLFFPQYWLLYSAPDGSFSSCFFISADSYTKRCILMQITFSPLLLLSLSFYLPIPFPISLFPPPFTFHLKLLHPHVFWGFY